MCQCMKYIELAISSQPLSLLYSAIVDADTTTLITYGSQEGVAVGYIPKRFESRFE